MPSLLPYGSPLIIDVAGPQLTAEDRARLLHPLVGGVIHFARNWESRAQMAALNAEIKALRADLLICVDHEGGRVQRFRSDGMTRLPSMRALGELWMTDAMGAVQAAAAVGDVLASELRAVGVDFSFAPVLDLDHGASTVIGDRSFHRDPRVVALLAQSLNQGMSRAGMAHCAKHFPGHGHVKADSHVAIPVDRRSLKAILEDDAQPFRWLAGTLTAVMPAHVIYQRVDERPAGFSRKWLQEVLRMRMGFDGAVFTDDLSMEAGRYIAGRQLGFAEAALEALGAGCDLALLCNQSLKPQLLDDFLASMERAVASGALTADPARERRRRSLLPTTPALDWNALQASARYQHARSVMAPLSS